MPRRPPVVHLLDTNGTVACTGVPLANAASAEAPRLTIYPVDATCKDCRRVVAARVTA